MQVVFLFYEGMTALDAIGPHEILSRLPGAKVHRAAIKSGPVRTDSNLIMMADCTLSDVSHADILLIPGAGKANTLREYPEVHAWLRTLHATTSWTTSVCTGSLILGAAGILSGVKATTHWAAMDRLYKWGALPISERIVHDGKVMTAAGVSAGIDMALVLAEKIAGTQFAQAMQLGIEYDPQPPFDVGSPKKANPLILEALQARMTANFERVE